MKDKKSLILLLMIIVSSVLVACVGLFWNFTYSLSDNPIAAAMIGIHDQVYLGDMKGQDADLAVSNLSIYPELSETATYIIGQALPDEVEDQTLDETQQEAESAPVYYDFTTVDDDYFADACFIGDSRTVGISKYSGIENATFLCATSLTIYDYDKQKITYNGVKTSIRDVLSQNQFGKIYIMFGINECSYGTPESYFESFANTVNDIRLLQPGAIVFVEGTLLVSAQKSAESRSINNDNISYRNYYLSLMANNQDIFYIDINESSLCENGALVADYTWDQVHIKAQYYEVWKEFFKEHGIVRENG